MAETYYPFYMHSTTKQKKILDCLEGTKKLFSDREISTQIQVEGNSNLGDLPPTILGFVPKQTKQQ